MKRLFAALVAISVLPMLASAQGMKPIKFEEYDLPNGLHVILYPEHSAPVVATRVFYHVGSKNEDPQRTGFAHFFEHLMFEATDHIKRGGYSKNVEMIGGNLNAFTANDETVYIDNCPSNYLNQALWAESERMHFLHVDSIGVETQRQVVKEERRSRYENQPYGSFILHAFDALFKGTPYQWTPIGEAQYIDAASIEEFQAFYHKYYVPNNATLVVAGDFKTADAKKAVSDYFGSIPRGTETINRPIIDAAQFGAPSETVVDEKMTPLPGLIYLYRTVGDGAPETYPLDLLNRVLSQGNSSRLYKRLVDKDQTAVDVSAFPLQLEQVGGYSIFATVKSPEDMPKVRAAIDEEIAKLQQDGISQVEFDKAMNQVTKDEVFAAASVETIAVGLAQAYAFHHNTNLVNEDLSKYQKLTRQDVQNAAKKFLGSDQKFVLIYPVAKEGQQ